MLFGEPLILGPILAQSVQQQSNSYPASDGNSNRNSNSNSCTASESGSQSQAQTCGGMVAPLLSVLFRIVQVRRQEAYNMHI